MINPIARLEPALALSAPARRPAGTGLSTAEPGACDFDFRGPVEAFDRAGEVVGADGSGEDAARSAALGTCATAPHFLHRIDLPP